MHWLKKRFLAPTLKPYVANDSLIIPPSSGEVDQIIADGNKDYKYMSIPLSDVPELATIYVQAMETEESEKWCRCEWLIHPDDTETKRGNCRECNQPKKAIVHSGLPEDIEFSNAHPFKGVRMRRGEQDMTCPVHTREGFLIYFFEWIKQNAG